MRYKLSLGLIGASALLILGNVAAFAQTNVTVDNSSPGTYGNIPYFRSGSVIANSTMVQAPNGNIGIKTGTTAPFFPLTVYGNAAFGYGPDTMSGLITMGKTPLVQIVGGGNPNANPGLGLLQLNINAPNMAQAAAEVYIGASGGTTVTTPVAVQNGALLGMVGFFGDDGTNVRTRGAFIHSYVDTGVRPVSTGVIPAGLVLGTTSSGPIIFGTRWNLANARDVDNPTQTAERMRIAYNGNVGIGTGAPASKLEVNGNIALTSGSGASMIYPDGTVQSTAWNGTTCGGDYAESVDVTGDRKTYEPGDVLVVDPKVEGKFLKSSEPYATTVMGIYSTQPGLTGRRVGAPKTGEEVPMAMLGIVPTKVSAENGAIKPGDLLVTSSTPGYAMKATDRSRMIGALIGKALGHLDSGVGVIEVGIALQ
ncbi:hypothetical protein [Terriglobus albidus]|uniref:hypothetical protein n=1 Tax=Terriglobus albidus TaxID=1592106 RepID=UPI0021DF5407|nr:hypothetical protein [Terriglobus albidus]